MIKESPNAAQEREARLDRLGDVLQEMEKYIDFNRAYALTSRRLLWLR